MRKNGYKSSAIQSKCECYLCHKNYTAGLEHHHVIHGTGQRKLADEDGLWVWLCRDCHSALHDKGEHDKDLQALGQKTFIQAAIKKGYPEEAAKELYFARYKKFYE